MLAVNECFFHLAPGAGVTVDQVAGRQAAGLIAAPPLAQEPETQDDEKEWKYKPDRHNEFGIFLTLALKAKVCSNIAYHCLALSPAFTIKSINKPCVKRGRSRSA
jgi:hypothetical protein